MREITLHLLDLAENSVSAGAQTVQIAVCEDLIAVVPFDNSSFKI